METRFKLILHNYLKLKAYANSKNRIKTFITSERDKKKT